MRKIELPIFKFEELSQDIKEKLYEGTKDIVLEEKMDEINSKVEEFVKEELKARNLGFEVNGIEIQDDEDNSYVNLEGNISEGIKQWDDEEDFFEFIPLIKKAELSINDGEYVLNMKYVEENVEDEDGEDIEGFIMGKVAETCSELIALGLEYKATLIEEFEASELQSLLDEKLNEFEYFKDGTVFDQEEMA